MPMKKPEFSKLIMAVASLLAIAVSVFTCAVVWKTEDTSSLEWLIPAVFAVLTTATGFYYSKAKAENKIKLMRKHKLDVTEDTINNLYDDNKEDTYD